MAARRHFPLEALIPGRLVLDDKAFDRIVDLLENPPAPTEALRELMRNESRGTLSNDLRSQVERFHAGSRCRR